MNYYINARRFSANALVKLREKDDDENERGHRVRAKLS